MCFKLFGNQTMLDIQSFRSSIAAVAGRLGTAQLWPMMTARFDTLEERRQSVQVKTEVQAYAIAHFQADRRTLKGEARHEECTGGHGSSRPNQNRFGAGSLGFGSRAKELDAWLLSIPNLPYVDVPFEAMKPKRRSAKSALLREFDFEISTMLIWANFGVWFRRWRELSGARFIVMRGQIARLQRQHRQRYKACNARCSVLQRVRIQHELCHSAVQTGRFVRASQ